MSLKVIQTSFKSNLPLTANIDREQNHSLTSVFSIVKPNVNRRQGSYVINCCMLKTCFFMFYMIKSNYGMNH